MRTLILSLGLIFVVTSCPLQAAGEATTAASEPAAPSKAKPKKAKARAGAEAEADTAPAAAPPPAMPAKLRLCHDDYAQRPGGRGLFSEDSKDFYHLSNLGPLPQQGAGKAIIYRYALHRIELASAKSHLVMAMDARELNDLILQGQQPPEGMLATAFEDNYKNCVGGPGEYLGLSLGKALAGRERTPVQRGSGTLQTIASPGFPFLHDADRKDLLSFDFDKLQTRRRFVSVGPDETLLYFNPNNGQKYAWHHSSTKNGELTRGLVAYESERGVAGRLKFEPQDRLVQSGKLFAAIQFKPSDHSLTMMELGRWSGAAKTQAFRVVLSKGELLDEAAADVALGKRLLVLSGRTDDLRKKWGFLSAYDYSAGQFITELRASAKLYIAFSRLAPSGEFLIAELRNRISQQTSHFSLYNFGKRSWTDISLAVVRGSRPSENMPK